MPRLCHLLTAFCFLASLSAQDQFQGVPRIVAVGDVHGGFDEFVEVLRAARLVDANNRWTGGKSHLVQTGDLIDRGPHSRRVLDLVIDLAAQARRDGGRVHALIGNHEAMNVYGDLRYLTAGDWEAFRTPKSAELRVRALEAAFEGRKPEAAEKAKWEAERPLGWVEHRMAFGESGKYGKWVRDRDVAVKINGVIFLHGGIGPKYASLALKEINRRVKAELRDFTKLEGGLTMDPEGPLWYRGLAQDAEDGLKAHLDQVLATHGASRIVIGHTVQKDVTPRFGGKVILIDVGLSRTYGGPRACLAIEGDRLLVIHGTQVRELSASAR